MHDSIHIYSTYTTISATSSADIGFAIAMDTGTAGLQIIYSQNYRTPARVRVTTASVPVCMHAVGIGGVSSEEETSFTIDNSRYVCSRYDTSSIRPRDIKV